MSITAKELAKRLGLSATAVSMALNQKPGVSTETRKRVIAEAERLGYDFTRHSDRKGIKGEICCIIYRAHNAILNYTPIFSEITDGIETQCRQAGYRMSTLQIYEDTDDVAERIADLRSSQCCGILLLGTELTEGVCRQFLKSSLPMVLLDTFFDSPDCSSVTINNMQGAHLATSYLIKRIGKQPGHLCSSYPIPNFRERRIGFEKAIAEHGMSVRNSITHELSPTMDGAFSDMLDVLDSGCELARCYFADNDLIAIGAMKALKLRGYRIPEDVAVIGFDNISEGRVLEPALTTIDIPRHFMGQTAVAQLIQQIESPLPHTLRIQISTSLIKRFSV